MHGVELAAKVHATDVPIRTVSRRREIVKERRVKKPIMEQTKVITAMVLKTGILDWLGEKYKNCRIPTGVQVYASIWGGIERKKDGSSYSSPPQ